MANAPEIRDVAWRRAKELLLREIDLVATSSRLDAHIGARKPQFWVDADVRRAALLLHGELSQKDSLAVIERLFGKARTPAKSSFARLWLKVSKAKKSGWSL